MGDLDDLDDLESSNISRLIGTDANGKETKPVRANEVYDLGVADSINSPGLQAEITLTPNVAMEIKVGASRLQTRKLCHAQIQTGGNVYWGWNSSVTTANGTRFFKHQMKSWPVEKDGQVWLVTAASGVKIRIGEA